jgi:hypothetical protein
MMVARTGGLVNLRQAGVDLRFTLFVEKCQCHPPFFHVDETVYDSVIQYMLLFFVVLGYLTKILAL